MSSTSPKILKPIKYIYNIYILVNNFSDVDQTKWVTKLQGWLLLRSNYTRLFFLTIVESGKLFLCLFEKMGNHLSKFPFSLLRLPQTEDIRKSPHQYSGKRYYNRWTGVLSRKYPIFEIFNDALEEKEKKKKTIRSVWGERSRKVKDIIYNKYWFRSIHLPQCGRFRFKHLFQIRQAVRLYILTTNSVP